MQNDNDRLMEYESRLNKVITIQGAMDHTVTNLRESSMRMHGTLCSYDSLFFRLLMTKPIRILNWFSCFAELKIEKNYSYSYNVYIKILNKNETSTEGKKWVRLANKKFYQYVNNKPDITYSTITIYVY